MNLFNLTDRQSYFFDKQSYHGNNLSEVVNNFRTSYILKYNNRVDVRGHKYVFGPTQNHFSPSVARVKMSSEEGQKHIYAQEHQLYYYYYNFKALLTFNFNFVFQKDNYT